MGRSIDADQVLQFIESDMENIPNDEYGLYLLMRVYNKVKEQPTIDPVKHGYVPIEVVRQIQWERDIAMSYLEEAGVSFGEKAELQRVKHGKWIKDMERDMLRCSVCKNFCVENWYYWLRHCPDCGARMDGE